MRRPEESPGPARGTPDEPPEFLVVGAGAIGSLLGALLVHSGRSVAFYDTDPAVRAALADPGVILDRPDGTIQVAARVVDSPAEALGAGWVALCVKAIHTREAAEAVRPLAAAGAVTVSFQNGLENGEVLAQTLAGAPIILTSMAVGAYLESPGHVVQTGNGPIRIGALAPEHTPRARQLAEILRSAGLVSEVSDHIRAAIWTKLAANVVINPITALLGVENGVLAALEPVRRLARTLIRELVDVARAEGIFLEPEELEDQVWNVVALTAKNRSSMLQDLLARRPPEIDALNGALVRIAARHGLAAPANETITNLTKALFSAPRSAGPDPTGRAVPSSSHGARD